LPPPPVIKVEFINWPCYNPALKACTLVERIIFRTMRIFLYGVFIFLSRAVYGQDGSLDLSFGIGGKVFFSPSDTINLNASLHIALQSDGKIIGVGSGFRGTSSDFITMRFNQNGTIDHSFGGKGYVFTDFGGNDIATCIAIQKDGKIITGGFSGQNANKNDFAISRFNTDGSLDHTFNSNGKLLTPFSTFDAHLFSIVLQPNGKILAGGDFDKSNQLSAFDFVVARYNSDGSLDPSFGNNGWTNTNLGYNERIFAINLQPDGRIVGGGLASQFFNYTRFALVRYNSNGSLDSSFNGSGTAILSTRQSPEYVRAIAIQPDGAILIAGESSRTDVLGNDMVLLRYKGNGLIDNSFGNNGILIYTTGIAANSSRNVLLQQDSKILLTGTATTSDGRSNFVTIRSKSDGLIDSSYGTIGKSIIPMPSCFATTSIFQGNRIIVGGTTHDGNNGEFALIRLLNAGDILNSTKEITLFPNPSSGDIFARIRGYDESMRMIIYDVLGRKVQEKVIDVFDPITITLITRNLPAALYNVVFTTSEGIITKQFIRH
jgi:uncharacterized delta-60 repeat protein